MKRNFIILNIFFVIFLVICIILSFYIGFFFFIPIICFLPFALRGKSKARENFKEFKAEPKGNGIKFRFCVVCGGEIKESIAKYCYHCGSKLNIE